MSNVLIIIDNALPIIDKEFLLSIFLDFGFGFEDFSGKYSDLCRKI